MLLTKAVKSVDLPMVNIIIIHIFLLNYDSCLFCWNKIPFCPSFVLDQQPQKLQLNKWEDWIVYFYLIATVCLTGKGDL